MRVVQFSVFLFGISFFWGVVAQQTQELSYDEMIEIEEVHLADQTASGTESTEGEDTETPVDSPDELEPPE